MSRHLNGKTFPKVEERQKYAQALRVTFEDFERLWQGELVLVPLSTEDQLAVENLARRMHEPVDVLLSRIVIGELRREADAQRVVKRPAGGDGPTKARGGGK